MESLLETIVSCRQTKSSRSRVKCSEIKLSLSGFNPRTLTKKTKGGSRQSLISFLGGLQRFLPAFIEEAGIHVSIR